MKYLRMFGNYKKQDNFLKIVHHGRDSFLVRMDHNTLGEYGNRLYTSTSLIHHICGHLISRSTTTDDSSQAIF